MSIFTENSGVRAHAVLLAAYGRDLALRGLKPWTRRMDLACVREYLERSGLLGVDVLTADAGVLANHQSWLEARPNRRRGGRLAPRTVQMHLRAICAFYAFLERDGRIAVNPASCLRAPRATTPARQVLTRGEIALLRSAARGPLERGLLAVFYGCGLRRAEGERLNVPDADLHGGLLHVRAGKGGRPRSVPMSAGVMRDLLPVVRLRRPHGQDALFVNRAGARMSGNTMYQRVKRMAARAGLARVVTLHGLRHAVATHLLEAGLTLEQTRAFLGHRAATTTELYTHVSPSEPEP